MSENIPASPEDSAAPWKLLQMMTGYWVTQALYVAAKLGIADLLREGPVNCDILASKTSTHPQSLYRTLRALASVGVFYRSRTGAVCPHSIGRAAPKRDAKLHACTRHHVRGRAVPRMG